MDGEITSSPTLTSIEQMILNNNYFRWIILIYVDNKLPAADRVTGHARGCVCEWVCPKLEGISTRK